MQGDPKKLHTQLSDGHNFVKSQTIEKTLSIEDPAINLIAVK